MNNKTLPALTVGAFLLAVGIGLIIYSATDNGILIVLWIALLIFGVFLLISSTMSSKQSGKFGPSDFSYRLAMGAIVATVGVIGLLYTFTDLSVWILVAIFIIVIAVVGMAIAFTNGKKEGA
jgi:membrane-bound ClpP family serine protease